MSFGERLRHERRARGLSQQELAGSRCSVSYVSHLEKGRRAPTPEVARYFETRLLLTPGTLMAEVDSPPSRREAGATALSSYERAQHLARAGSLGTALELAEQTLGRTEPKSDLGYLTRTLIATIQSDLGRYPESVETFQKLREDYLGRESLVLNIEIALSRAQRLAGQGDAAHVTALEAIQKIHGLDDEEESRRSEALISAIATSNDQDERKELEEALVAAAAAMDEGHVKGRAQWALGTAALERGDIQGGQRWYRSALENLSPAASFRDWARFPRAAAHGLLEAHATDGVEDYLNLAKARLEIFPAPDEVATLHLNMARYKVAVGAVAEAEGILREALADEEISAITNADLLFELAVISTRDDKLDLALRAARLYTNAGSLRGATKAWNYIGTLPGGEAP